jgi:hypothetical protein
VDEAVDAALTARTIQALAWFEFGHLAEAADAARTAQATARSLGFDRHFFAVDYLRTLAGLALDLKHRHQNPALIESCPEPRSRSTWATFRTPEDFRLFVVHGRRASLNRGDGRAGHHASVLRPTCRRQLNTDHAAARRQLVKIRLPLTRRNERSLVMTSPQNEK